MPRSSWARAPQLLSLCSGARQTQLLGPRATTTEVVVRNKRGHHSEKPAHRSKEWPSLSATRKPAHSNKDPTKPKINLKKKVKLEISRSSNNNKKIYRVK